jgi:hypothetical protein
MRRLFGAGALAAVLLLAGCGGGGSSDTTTTTALQSATEWAGNFCGAFSTWKSSLGPIGQSLLSNPTKESLQSAGDDIRSANDALVDDLKSLGKPAIPRGEEAKDVVDQLATDIKGDSDKISNAVSDVSTVADIVDAASVVSTTLVQLETQVQDAVTDLKAIRADEDNSLNQAFADAPACADLESIS